MLKTNDARAFRPLNRAYNHVFQPDRLTVGLVVPLETYQHGPVPQMERHIERIQLAERLGFSAIWLRDVPFNVPSFGDAGQIYDPFVYLGMLAGQTSRIALGVASIILPLRHPAHVAKSAASIDVLSEGRLLLGIASGDRPDEYPAMNVAFDDRGSRFRESVDYIRQMGTGYAPFENDFGASDGGIDMLPKPVSGRLPLLITGGSQQSPDWVAQNGDGWMTYPRQPAAQAAVVRDYRQRTALAGEGNKPVMQSLYFDLDDLSDASPRPIHLGFRSGITYLHEHLKTLEAIGINHVALNLRFNQADTEATMKRLADDILPSFADQGYNR